MRVEFEPMVVEEQRGEVVVGHRRVEGGLDALRQVTGADHHSVSVPRREVQWTSELIDLTPLLPQIDPPSPFSPETLRFFDSISEDTPVARKVDFNDGDAACPMPLSPATSSLGRDQVCV